MARSRSPGSRPPRSRLTKTLEDFERGASTIPGATLDYLASLEWVTARENICLVGPAGTGKAVAAGGRASDSAREDPAACGRRAFGRAGAAPARADCWDIGPHGRAP